MKTARTIWRTVVVAGAMIGSPIVARADAPAPPKNAPVDKASDPPADKAPPGNKPVDKAPAEKAPKDGAGSGAGSGSGTPAKNKPVDGKPRPRANDDRPRGRGFVLA